MARSMRGNWFLLVAIKAILLSVVAIGAAVVLTKMALPKLVDTLHGMGREPSPWVKLGLKYQDWLPMLPGPGLLLGVAAVLFRPLRPLLAMLGILAAVGAIAIIIGLLIGSMAPLYEVPAQF